MDGTIIDSTNAIVKHWHQIGKEIGVDPEVILATSHGRRSIDVLSILEPSRANWECECCFLIFLFDAVLCFQNVSPRQMVLMPRLFLSPSPSYAYSSGLPQKWLGGYIVLPRLGRDSCQIYAKQSPLVSPRYQTVDKRNKRRPSPTQVVTLPLLC